MDNKNKLSQSEKRPGSYAPDSSGEIYYQAFHKNPVIIGISRISDGCYLEANESFTTILGYSREEIIGHTSFELNIWHDSGERKQFLAELAENKRVLGKEVKMRSKDGRILVFRASVDRIEIENQPCLLVLLEDITERKLTEEALRVSEEKHRLLLENANEAIVVVQNGAIRYANAKAAELTGYFRQEMLGLHFSTFIYPDDLETVSRNYNLRLKGEIPVPEYEFRVRRKDGSVGWVEANGALISWEGSPATLNLLNVITERKIAEEKLKHSEELFRLMAENAKDLVFRISIRPEVKLEYISPSVLEFTGYTVEEHYRDYTILFNLRHSGERMSNNDKDIVEQASHGREMLWTRKDGSLIWVEERVQPVFGSSGQITGMEGIIRDITERKQAEAALADEATRRRILVDQSKDGIVVLDESGAVFESNRCFAEMLGYSQQEIMQLHVWDWEYQFDRSSLLQMLTSVDEKGSHFETTHRRKDGSYINVEISGNGAVCSGHKLIFCVCRDITERKRMEQTVIGLYEKEKKQREELQEEARARGLFIDVLAHELRTPLTPILASTTMLSDLLATSENGLQQRLAANVQNSAQTLAGRLEELLEMARYSRGTFKLKKKSTDISRFVEEVAARFKPTLEAGKQQLRLIVPERLPQIELDRSCIEQVLINLLSNATKFAPDKDITLEIKLDKNGLVFSVIDTGVGISAEEQNRIFQPYHRVEQDRQKFPGIGLGLAVCKQIIEAHGGRIWVKSERDQGSTFSFSLPVNPS